jgi:hypothetical protein
VRSGVLCYHLRAYCVTNNHLNSQPHSQPHSLGSDFIPVAMHDHVGANYPFQRLWLDRLQRERIMQYRVRSTDRILLPSYRPDIVLLLHGRRRLRQL